MDDRTDAVVNGALIVLGLAAIIDNVLFHWILEWHRLIEGMPNPEIFLLELGVVVVGFLAFFVGSYREFRNRKAN